MSTNISFYIVNSVGGVYKLGSVLTVKDVNASGVIESIADDLGIGGWNKFVVNGKSYNHGPGLKAEDIIHFKVDSLKSVIELYHKDVDYDFVAPKMAGYSYVVPNVEDDVVDEGGSVAPDGHGSGESFTENGLKKMKKQELLDILGDDGDGHLTKSELISIILKK